MTPSNGPLCGVKIVELAGFGPGPFAGADVIRVDRPQQGDAALPARFDLLRRTRDGATVGPFVVALAARTGAGDAIGVHHVQRRLERRPRRSHTPRS